MLVLIDTSTSQCRLTVVNGDDKYYFTQDLDRNLARYILRFMEDSLTSLGSGIRQISGLGVMKGPGSFTGLRIGLTVVNTLAESLEVKIVGEMGANWQESAIRRLNSGENDQIVLPYYDREANVTHPKK